MGRLLASLLALVLPFVVPDDDIFSFVTDKAPVTESEESVWGKESGVGDMTAMALYNRTSTTMIPTTTTMAPLPPSICLTSEPRATASSVLCPHDRCCFVQHQHFPLLGFARSELGCGECTGTVLSPHPEIRLGPIPFCTSYTVKNAEGEESGPGLTCLCKGSLCNAAKPTDGVEAIHLAYRSKSVQRPDLFATRPPPMNKCWGMDKSHVLTHLVPPAVMDCPEECCSWVMELEKGGRTVSADCGVDCPVPASDSNRVYNCSLVAHESADNHILCICTGYLCNSEVPNIFSSQLSEDLDQEVNYAMTYEFPITMFTGDFYCASTGAREVGGVRVSVRFYTLCHDCCFAYRAKDLSMTFPIGCHLCGPGYEGIVAKRGISRRLRFYEPHDEEAIDAKLYPSGLNSFPWIGFYATLGLYRCRGEDYCNEEGDESEDERAWGEREWLDPEPRTLPRGGPRTADPHSTFPELDPPFNVWPMTMIMDHAFLPRPHPALTAALLLSRLLSHLS